MTICRENNNPQISIHPPVRNPQTVAQNDRTYLHIRIRQPRIRHNRRTAIQYLHTHIRQPRLHRQSRTRHNNNSSITHLPLIPSLLPQLPHSGFLRRLALVDQAGGEFDADGFDRRSVLEDDQSGRGLGRVAQDGRNGNGVDAGFAAGFAGGGFPDAVAAGLLRRMSVVCRRVGSLLVVRT